MTATPASPAGSPQDASAATRPEPFGARLQRVMDARGRLCVGIDPHASLLAAWGLDDDVAGLDRFAMTVVDALGEHAAVLKPQSAFFERFGSRGTAVLERATARAREAGALVLTDAKRGDIGSTMAAYAATYLDPASPLFTDAVTVSPYLGFESLRPALDMARAAGAGVFVLALTSNPEGAQVQRASGADGRSVAQTVLDAIAAENARDAAALAGGAADAAPGARDGGPSMGSVGAVVGATLAAADAGLSVGGPLLAPGIGAQGATPADLPALFGPALPYVLPSVSRDVLRHGPDVAGLRNAARRYAEEVAEAVNDRR